MAPKYPDHTYFLGTKYPTWGPLARDRLDQAFNMINPKSEAGKILNGIEQGCVRIRDAEEHIGTDVDGREHVNFKIHYSNGHVTSDCHLYYTGEYTAWYGRWISYSANESGRVLPVLQQQAVPSLGDLRTFPPLF